MTAVFRVDEVGLAEAREFASWRYDGIYSLYDPDPDDWQHYLDPAWGYRTLRDQAGAVVGNCCFGRDARVPGGSYQEDAVDLGGGLRPELTGRGRGSEFLAAVIGEAERLFPGRRLRVTVACFNQRALRLVVRARFSEVERFTGPAGREFAVLLR